MMSDEGSFPLTHVDDSNDQYIQNFSEMIQAFKDLNITNQKTEQTFMQVTGYPHFENVCSNLLSFFFNTEEAHGFKDLFIKSLLECIGEGKGSYITENVDREYTTDKNNRIDIVIETENHLIGDENNYLNQDERIKKDGGLDAILLGIGADGHYCGNLPNTTSFDDFTSKVDCDERLKNRIKPHFENEADIPDLYVTMGPRSIMAAERLLLIANGTRKAEIMKEFIEGTVDPSIPASILKMHPNLTVIMDEDAASLLTNK